jgi:hypothetical protein
LKSDGPKARIVCCSVANGERAVAFPWHGKAVEAMRGFLFSDVPKIGQNIQFETRWTLKEFGKRVRTIGFDIAVSKVAACQRGTDPSRELPDEALAAAHVERAADLVENGYLRLWPSRLDAAARLVAITAGGILVLLPFTVLELVLVAPPAFSWQAVGLVVAAAVLRPERMGTIDLFQYIRHLNANGQSAQKYEIQFWKKVFYPMSCLVMVVLSLPFGYLHLRNTPMNSMVFLGVIIGVSFFLFNNLFGFIGNLNAWSPWLAAATPGLIYMSASLLAFGWLVLRH